MRVILHALRRAAGDKVARWSAVVAFLIFVPVYAIALPTSLTGGHFGWINLRFLSVETAAFALAMSFFLALIVLLMVFVLREGQRARGTLAASGALLGLLAPLLCCSPILPILFGVIASAWPAMATTLPGPLQGFISRHETAFLMTALLLMLLALYQNARRAMQGPSCRIQRPAKC